MCDVLLRRRSGILAPVTGLARCARFSYRDHSRTGAESVARSRLFSVHILLACPHTRCQEGHGGGSRFGNICRRIAPKSGNRRDADEE